MKKLQNCFRIIKHKGILFYLFTLLFCLFIPIFILTAEFIKQKACLAFFGRPVAPASGDMLVKKIECNL